jgi:hypothetical protein
MKLYRDFFINIAAGWFFVFFAAAGQDALQAIVAAVLCISCFLLAEELDRWRS